MIVATAGHIDHGKTLLVRTLTGVDTDRLPEEKARGISIDLGFAYWPLPGGDVIGFVDVPGHERFIRNMLAGVCGIDFALLVVAADDGVMPQTVEHLNILNLLDIQHGVVAVTKVDRVAPERVTEVTSAVKSLLSGTCLEASPVMAVSAVAGAGIEELRQALVAASQAQFARAAEGQHFRLAIDRAFTVAGSGTVVTGTVFNGTVTPGERLVISPKGTPVRVRGIQMRGTSTERAQAGQRCALNLTGADLETVARGDWVLQEAIHAPTRRLDARVTVLAGEEHALEHWTPLHVHLATADVTARIAIRGGGAIGPGASGIAQLTFDKPVGALHGDRFILRDQSARRTLGGGVIVDPFARAGRRAAVARAAELSALAAGPPETVLSELIKCQEQGVDLARFERAFNLKPELASRLYAGAGIMALGKETRIGIPVVLHDELRAKIPAAVREFHRKQPQAVGIELSALREQLAPKLPAEVIQLIARGLADERLLQINGTAVRLPGHDATANPEDEKMWQTLQPVLQAGGANPPVIAELAQKLKLKEPALKDFLHRKSRSGEVMRVKPDRFYLRSTVASLAATAHALAQRSPGGTFTAAQYRDAIGVGRGLAIEILEFLDTQAITQRVGDARKMRKDYATVLGAAEPLKPPAKSQGNAAADKRR